MKRNQRTIKLCIRSGLIVLSALLLLTTVVLFSRFQFQSGLSFLRKGEYEKALQAFNASLSALPLKNVLAYVISDVQKNHTAIGETYFLKAGSSNDLASMAETYQLATDHFTTAVNLNPYDSVAAIGLARGFAARELLYGIEHPDEENPFNASPYFITAIRLRPNSIDLHFNYCSYLAEKGDRPALQEALSHLLYIYPRAYYRVRQEPYYTPWLSKYLKQGLEKAIDEGINLREAYAALSTIERDTYDLQGAIENYAQLLAVWPQKNDQNTYFRYGQLLLMNKNKKDAAEQFITALKISQNKDDMIRQIYAVYTRQREFSEFVNFGAVAQSRLTLSELMDICIGRALASAGQIKLGEARLQRVSNKRYEDEKLYHLAKIYEEQKRWSDMELAIQRATVIQPDNSGYYSLFAKALSRQGKQLQAEGAIDRAIESSTKPNRWLYNQRGWIRWSQNKYQGALNDWLKAIELDPDRAVFYYHVSLAYQKLDNPSQSCQYAEKAVAKAPDNEQYLKQLQECN